jgi:hypothetical protein
MIITKLQGGLGNQLFQWAVTRNLSIKYNTDYYFDLNYISKGYDSVTSRGLDIDKFENLLINPMTHNPNLPTMVDKFKYYNMPDNSYLDGYWQSEKYFKENEFLMDGKPIFDKMDADFLKALDFVRGSADVP